LGCSVLVSPFFGETEPALSEAEGAGTLISDQAALTGDECQSRRHIRHDRSRAARLPTLLNSRSPYHLGWIIHMEVYIHYCMHKCSHGNIQHNVPAGTLSPYALRLPGAYCFCIWSSAASTSSLCRAGSTLV
jgi:hypothetical protein